MATNKSSLVLIMMIFILFCCSEDGDPGQQGPPPPPPGGDVTITSVEGGHMFWGDEMTIKGSGFSTNKADNIVKLTSVALNFCGLNYTSAAGGDIEIISASATQLIVKIPYKKIGDMPSCGPERATLEVTVNGKTAKKEGVKFTGLPWIGSFNYHYGWFDVPNVTRIGDSVMIDGGLRGYYAQESDLWDQIVLTIDGKTVPNKFRVVGLESGRAFYLPVDEYGDYSCSDEPEGWAPARKMTFTLSVAGKSVSTDLYVQYLPPMTAGCYECPASTQELNLNNPRWTIKGSNIYFTEARFTPLAPCSGGSQGVTLSKNKPFDDEVSFQVPLAILADGCSYSVTLGDDCERSQLIGVFSK